MTASTTRACYTSRVGRLDGWKSNREASHNRCSSQRNAARQSRAREACVTEQALRGAAPPYRVRPSSLFFWESAVRFLICVAMLAFVRGAISKFCRLVVVPVGSGAIQLRRAGLGSLVRCDLLPAARWVCSARRVRLRCLLCHEVRAYVRRFPTPRRGVAARYSCGNNPAVSRMFRLPSALARISAASQPAWHH